MTGLTVEDYGIVCLFYNVDVFLCRWLFFLLEVCVIIIIIIILIISGVIRFAYSSWLNSGKKSNVPMLHFGEINTLNIKYMRIKLTK